MCYLAIGITIGTSIGFDEAVANVNAVTSQLASLVSEPSRVIVVTAIHSLQLIRLLL
jgi:hypothetical protein